jgi:hypothetical protein
MTPISRFVAALLVTLAGLAVLPAAAQAPQPGPGAPPPPRPQVFVDWPGGDIGALRTEIPFVEFMTDLAAAEVHVTVVPQSSPEGERFAVAFSGLKRFLGDDNTLSYVPEPGAQPGDVRSGLTGTIKLGLLRYAAKSPVARDISVRFLDQARPTAVDDPWNSWIFSLSGNSFLMGETQYRSGSYYASFSANRVRPELKVQTAVYYNQNDVWFDLGDGSIYDDSTYGFGASALVVKSLGEHWSAGGYVEAESSSYSNLDLGFTLAPAVEFNVYPYSESTKRQFRFLYRLGFSHARYIEETIYFKTSENLLQGSLTCAFEVVRPWGNATIRLEGSHYFHDFSKNRLELMTELDIRVWGGLSFEVGASYARIHDQLSLPAGGASYEEILLRQKQLATGYNYSVSFGFNFSFGSTRSQVVNPRFGDGGRSISIHM